jgi:hypothetical protein
MAEDDKKDRVYVGPKMDSGYALFVREHADGSTSSGVLSADTEKLADATSVGRLKHIEDNVFELRDEVKFTQGSRKGPAKVNSQAYRSGWDGIFGPKKPPVGQA